MIRLEITINTPFKGYRTFFTHLYLCAFSKYAKYEQSITLAVFLPSPTVYMNSRRARSLSNRRDSWDCSESVQMVYSVCQGSSSRRSVHIGCMSSCCIPCPSTMKNTKVHAEEKFRKITGGQCFLLLMMALWAQEFKVISANVCEQVNQLYKRLTCILL